MALAVVIGGLALATLGLINVSSVLLLAGAPVYLWRSFAGTDLLGDREVAALEGSAAARGIPTG